MKQSAEPAKSFGAGSRGSCRKFGCARNSRNSSLSSRAKAVTRAPERTRSSARRAATTPPPTTTAGRSRMSMKIGRSRITPARPGLQRAPARPAAANPVFALAREAAARALPRIVDETLDPRMGERIAQVTETRHEGSDHDAVAAPVDPRTAAHAIAEFGVAARGLRAPHNETRVRESVPARRSTALFRFPRARRGRAPADGHASARRPELRRPSASAPLPRRSSG